MKTNNKIVAVLVLAGMLAFGFTVVGGSESQDAAEYTTVTSEQFLATEGNTVADVTVDGNVTTYTMKTDVKMSGELIIDITPAKSVIIDADGYEFVGSYKWGSIVLKSGILELKGGIFYNGVEVRGNTTSDEFTSKLIVSEDATIGINSFGIVIGGSDKTEYGMVVDVKGAVTGSTEGNSAIWIMGNLGNSAESYAALSGADNAPTLYIRSTAVIGGDSSNVGIAHNGYARTTIESGAEIEAGSADADAAVFVKRGDVTINGGMFYCGRTAMADVNNITSNGSGTEAVGSAVAITSTYNNYGKIKVSINGGDFSSYSNGGLIVAETINGSARNYFTNGESVIITGGQFVDSKGFQTGISASSALKLEITGGFFSIDPTQYVIQDYKAKLVGDIYCVGKESDDGSITVNDVEEAEDGTTVSTESVIKTDDSGKVTSATVTIRTEFGSIATAKVNASGSATLTSDTKGAVYLSDAAFEDLVGLMQSASGSDRVSLNVATLGTSVSLGAYATEAVAEGSIGLSITVNRGLSDQATITLNQGSLEAGCTYTLSVVSNPSMAGALRSAGLTGTTPFDIELTSEGVIVNLDGSVTVSVPVDGKYDNMRMYCIDNGDSYAAIYSAGSVTATIDHFSTWAVVYDKPVVVVDDEDDILFILEQQKKAQEAAASQTTTEDNSGEEAAIIIAAAAVAGAMLACAFFAFRRP